MASTYSATNAAEYERFMGRWSRRLAASFLDFVGVADGDRLIDVGCGTGSLTFLLPDRAAVRRVDAVDSSGVSLSPPPANETAIRVSISIKEMHATSNSTLDRSTAPCRCCCCM